MDSNGSQAINKSIHHQWPPCVVLCTRSINKIDDFGTGGTLNLKGHTRNIYNMYEVYSE